MNEHAPPKAISKEGVSKPSLAEDIIDLTSRCKIPADVVGEVYRDFRGKFAQKLPFWNTLVALSAGTQDVNLLNGLYLLLARQIEKHEQAHLFMHSLIKRALQDQKTQDRINQTEALKKYFPLQEVMQQQSALAPGDIPLSIKTLSRWSDFTLATALVYADQQIRGTGFLVAPDLVLTACHVVFDNQKNRKNNIKFHFCDETISFKEGINQFNIQKILCKSDEYQKAFPHEDLEPDEKADGCLDYALINLSHPVSHCHPVPLSCQPQSADANVLVFNVGTAGGEMLGCDFKKGVWPTQHGKRLKYRNFTTGGYSGGPVFNETPEVIGLHEAGWPQTDEARKILRETPEQAFNRGIDIAAIIEHIKGQKNSDKILASIRNRNPFAPLKTMKVFRNDSHKWRENWIKRVNDLAGTENLSSAWRDAIMSLTDPSDDSTRADSSSFYPLFPREDLSEWLEEAASPDTHTFHRVLVIPRKAGVRGCGMTFIEKLVEMDLRGYPASTFMLRPDQLQHPWSEALKPFTQWEEAKRPEKGTTRYDQMENIIKTCLRADQQEKGTLHFMLMDMTAIRDKSTADLWIELARALSGHSNQRVILIDPPFHDEQTLRNVFNAKDANNERFQQISALDHIDWPDIKRTIKKLDGAFWNIKKTSKLKEAWEAQDRLYRLNPDLKTVEAVGFVINRHRIIGVTP